jgi:hypothetical protein
MSDAADLKRVVAAQQPKVTDALFEQPPLPFTVINELLVKSNRYFNLMFYVTLTLSFQSMII